MLDHADQVAGARVLDLASGSGLVAIAAALAGGAPVMAAEIDSFAEVAIALNSEANGVYVDVKNRADAAALGARGIDVWRL